MTRGPAWLLGAGLAAAVTAALPGCAGAAERAETPPRTAGTLEEDLALLILEVPAAR